jgi:hypothetical protein
MGLSLWGQIGALVGATFGFLNYRVIIGILEPRLRATDKSPTAEERNAFERRIVLLKRIFFAFEVVVLGVVGYYVGTLLEG